eukprot:1838965-Prymnesium_polylepis.1
MEVAVGCHGPRCQVGHGRRAGEDPLGQCALCQSHQIVVVGCEPPHVRAVVRGAQRWPPPTQGFPRRIEPVDRDAVDTRQKVGDRLQMPLPILVIGVASER